MRASARGVRRIQWRPEEGFEPLVVFAMTDSIAEAIEKRFEKVELKHEIAWAACEALCRVILSEARDPGFALHHLLRHFETRDARTAYFARRRRERKADAEHLERVTELLSAGPVKTIRQPKRGARRAA